MKTVIDIENIEDLRRQQGIEDIELRQRIRSLRRGDEVRLTFLTPARTFETLLVRITSVRGCDYVGRLAEKPHSPGLKHLDSETRLDFSSAHIHSIPKEHHQDCAK